MNFLGKALIGFILVMSIAFLALAIMVGASQRNWKDQALKNKNEFEQAKRTLQDVKASSDTMKSELEREKVSRALQIQQLASQAQIDKTNRDQAVKQLTEKQVENTALQTNLSSVEARLKQQDNEVETLKTTNKGLVAEIAQKRTEVVELTNQINQANLAVETLESRTKDQAAQLARLEKVIRANGLNAESLTSHIPSKVDGVVVEVSKTRDLESLVVSLGMDDGIREGHTMDIYRGSQFIGKATVVKSESDRSILKVAPEYRQTAVREGDHVTTKF